MDLKKLVKPVGIIFLGIIIFFAIFIILLTPLLTDPLIDRNAATVAAETIKNGITIPGTPISTGVLRFINNQSLGSSSLASKVQSINQGQICLSKGDFNNDSSFYESSGKQITYTGSSEKYAKMVVLCESGSEIIQLADDLPGIKGSWLSQCPSCTAGNETCCLGLVRKLNS